MNVDYQLNEDVVMLRETVRQFAEKRIVPIAEDIDRENEFPHYLWKELGNLGLLGITVSKEYGGSEMSYLAHLVAVEEISRASASVGLSYGVHSNLCVNQIQINGSPTQKEKFLPKLCSGEHVGALAMSEPGAGSDLASLNTKAEDKGDHYLINGVKTWTTMAQYADWMFCLVRTSQELSLIHISEPTRPY